MCRSFDRGRQPETGIGAHGEGAKENQPEEEKKEVVE